MWRNETLPAYFRIYPNMCVCKYTHIIYSMLACYKYAFKYTSMQKKINSLDKYMLATTSNTPHSATIYYCKATQSTYKPLFVVTVAVYLFACLFCLFACEFRLLTAYLSTTTHTHAATNSTPTPLKQTPTHTNTLITVAMCCKCKNATWLSLTLAALASKLLQMWRNCCRKWRDGSHC